MTEQKVSEEQWTSSQKPQHSRGRSLFGPIVLIAAGVFFLLANLNVIPELNWAYALNFWPLLLIFIGLNILVVQVRAPGGTILSLLVSLVAVAVFGYLLLAGPQNSAVRALGVDTPSATLKEESFSVPVGNVDRAEIEIDLSNYPAEITGLADSSNLIEGTIWTGTGLALDSETDEGRALVRVGEQSGVQWFFNPFGWMSETGQDTTWRIRVNEGMPVDLQVNAGNGSATAELESLNLSRLRLDVGNGSVVAALPAGTYGARIDGGNGSLRLTLGGQGQQEMDVDGGNGSMAFFLPAGMAARVEFDEGNGSVAVDERFELVDGDRERGVYETPGYASASDSIRIQLDTGNGSFRLSEP